MTRRVAAFDPAETSFLLQIVIGAVVLTLVGPSSGSRQLRPTGRSSSLRQLGAIGPLFLRPRALVAPAVVVQPFTYTLLLYAVVIGYLLFGDVPDLSTLARLPHRGRGRRLRRRPHAQAPWPG